MFINKTVLAICCVILIGIGGCSRQQSDWQKAREANSTDAYEQFLKKYPSGEFSAQAQGRLKEQYEERDWQKARDTDTLEAYQAFLQQYPEGKDTEEARVRVENFTLAQTPSGTGSAPGSVSGGPNGTAPNLEEPAGSSSSPAGSGSAPGRSSSMQPPAVAAPSGEESAPPGDVPGVSSRHRAERPAASAKSASGPRSESGKYAVQLGAFKSGHAAARERWEHLQKEYPKLFAGLSSKVVPKKSGGTTLYRLQAVGISESHARSICNTLRAKSQACVLIRPQHVT
jgi:cell division protein FtsN